MDSSQIAVNAVLAVHKLVFEILVELTFKFLVLLFAAHGHSASDVFFVLRKLKLCLRLFDQVLQIRNLLLELIQLIFCVDHQLQSLELRHINVLSVFYCSKLHYFRLVIVLLLTVSANCDWCLVLHFIFNWGLIYQSLVCLSQQLTSQLQLRWLEFFYCSLDRVFDAVY